MSGLETAIRNALERSDRSNAEIRARIYQSARQALEAGLRKQEVDDPDVLALQRHRLEETIKAIEMEERARLHPPAVAPEPLLRPRAQTPAGPTRRQEPRAEAYEMSGAFGRMRQDDGLDGLRAEKDGHPAAEMQAGSPGTGERLDVRPDVSMRPRRRRRGLFSRLFISSVMLATLGMAAWWIYSSGILLTPAERDTGVANPPATIRDQDFPGANGQSGGQSQGLKTLGPQAGFSSEWVEVFKPADIARIRLGIKAAMEVVSSGDGPAVRLTSSSSGGGGELKLEISPDILRQLAGKRFTIALTMQAASEKPTQVAVECAFASLGDCGRHRFTVTQEKHDVLFQAAFSQNAAPNGPGYLVINSDLDGAGQAVNLFAVRALPGQ